MNKKLVCLVLVFMMIFSFALSSCSVNSTEGGDVSETEDEDANILNRVPVTLTLWLPGEATEEAVQAVEDALNDILKPNYTTGVDLRVISRDEYDAEVQAQVEKLEQKIKDDAAAEEISKEIEASRREEGITAPPTEAATTAPLETVIDEYNKGEIKYPAVGEYQFDIFLITSYDMYLDYIDRVAITSVQELLDTNYKSLKEYIYPTFLSAASFAQGETYAIPNNHGIGSMKFVLMNKELIRHYDYNENDLLESIMSSGSLAVCEEFIRDVGKDWCLEHPETAPLLSWVDPAGMTYWSDNGDWSVLASLVGNNTYMADFTPITSIFQNAEYKANFKMMKALEEDGYIASDPDSVEDFAVAVVDGNSLSEIEEKYGEDYFIGPYDVPMATQEDLFGAAFAISEATANAKRAMEVITAINTKPEIRNLLQYGVEGVHYNLNDDGRVERILDENGNSPYMMNIYDTGNVYMAYPEEDMPADKWESDKWINQRMKLSPYAYVPGLRNSENEANFAEIKKLSEDLYKKLMATSSEDVDKFFAEADAELMANELFAQMVGNDWEFGVEAIYKAFYDENLAPADEGGEGGEEGGADSGAAGDETTAAA